MGAFFKKVLYAVGANLLSLLVSVLTTLIVPKFFGDAVEQYGYLKIYLFYVGYIGFFIWDGATEFSARRRKAMERTG